MLLQTSLILFTAVFVAGTPLKGVKSPTAGSEHGKSASSGNLAKREPDFQANPMTEVQLKTFLEVLIQQSPTNGLNGSFEEVTKILSTLTSTDDSPASTIPPPYEPDLISNSSAATPSFDMASHFNMSDNSNNGFYGNATYKRHTLNPDYVNVGLGPRTDPPKEAYVVGPNEKYTTLAAACRAIEKEADRPGNEVTLFIRAGTYYEQLIISLDEAQLVVQGETPTPGDAGANTVNIKYGLAAKDVEGHHPDKAATLQIDVRYYRIYNINAYNTFGHPQIAYSQNIVLAQKKGSSVGLYAVGLYGNQDTLHSEGDMIVARSIIVGAIDFVYGRQGQTFVLKSSLLFNGPGCLTASGRETPDIDAIIVIADSEVDAIDADAAKKIGTHAALGRPWEDYARVVIQKTFLAEIVDPRGWIAWTDDDPHTDHAEFIEFQNSGPGATQAARQFLTQGTGIVTLESVFGPNFENEWWVDQNFL